MGNSNNVEIKINSSQYWPNSIIKGLVVIHNVEKTLKHIKNLYLHFQGYETGENVRYSRNIVSSMRLLKDMSNEDLNIKTITIPFTYRIPNNIYSTLEKEEYGIKYSLALFSESVRGWTEEIQKIPITIVERANMSKELRTISRVHQMSGYLFTYKGEMKVECKLHGNEFYIGDTVNLKILFDLRKCQQFVEDVFICLIEKITINDPQQLKMEEKIIKISELPVPGLFQGSIQEFSIPFLLFNMKDSFLPSTNGQLVQLDYIIRLKAHSTKFNVNNNELCIDIPIKICRPAIDSGKLDLKPQQFQELHREYCSKQSDHYMKLYFLQIKIYDRSLLTVDILGAQPKSRHNYMNRLLPNQLSFDEQQRLQQKIPQMDYKFGRRRYQHDFHHFTNICVPQGEDHFLKSQKKHFEIPQNEIQQYRALENHYDVPKLLCTNDIDGAVPGTLMSKAVKNQEIAQKLRFNREEIKLQQNRALYNSHIEETFVQQQNEDLSPPQRKKSYSVYTSPAQNLEPPKYEYMNKPLKLPPITERISAAINPISNKLQLRQSNRNYLLEDYEKTLKILQKQPPLRLFV